MIPSEIEQAARLKYNSVGSSFFSQNEIFDLIYQAELEIAQETRLLEGLTTTTSTASTRSYAFPSGVSEIKRVEYDGQKLEKIDFRDDDQITLYDSDATATGKPLYYSEWNNTLYLRPIPDTSSVTIRIYYYKLPARITSASQTIEVPILFHMCLVDYVVGELASKDMQPAFARNYKDKWYNIHLPNIKKWVRKHKIGDSFNVVKDEDQIVGSFIGRV